MSDRTATIQRQTKETTIELTLDLDGTGQVSAATGIGFLDHMLDHLGTHSVSDLTVRASGDLEVDDHHTCEDVAICLGQALSEALGDKAGITRYGTASAPMDESLAKVSLDLSGRAAIVFNVSLSNRLPRILLIVIPSGPLSIFTPFVSSFTVTVPLMPALASLV